jgi:single-strand DNA-binding protein
MSSVGLNKWIVSGNLGADAEIKTVELKNGEKAKVAEATIYVRKPRNRDEAFTVQLSIWEGSTAWRRLPFLKKGSLIICTGNLEPNPYISKTDNQPKAGLAMNVLDIDLDNIRNLEDEAEQVPAEAIAVAPVSVAASPVSAPVSEKPATVQPVAQQKAATAAPAAAKKSASAAQLVAAEAGKTYDVAPKAQPLKEKAPAS